jgi:hypothetical protein
MTPHPPTGPHPWSNSIAPICPDFEVHSSFPPALTAERKINGALENLKKKFVSETKSSSLPHLTEFSESRPKGLRGAKSAIFLRLPVETPIVERGV